MSGLSMRRVCRLVFGLWIVAASAVAVFSAEPGGKGEKKPVPAVLVYEVDPQPKGDGQPVDMKRVLAALDRRLNPGFLSRAKIREVAQGRIEIVVLNSDQANVQRIERLVESAGTLEFRIAANTRDHQSIVERAKLLSESETKVFGDRRPDDREPPLLAWWVPVFENRENSLRSPTFVTRKVKADGKEVMQVLVMKDPFDITGEHLSKAAASTDERGRPNVAFTLDYAEATLFGRLTSLNLPDEIVDFHRALAIILDGKIYSAPRIQSRIFDKGQISGNFTQTQAEDLADVLNAGPLEVRLKRVADGKKGP